MPLTFPPAAATASVTDLTVIPGFNPLNRLSPARTDVEYQLTGNFAQPFPAAGGAPVVLCNRAAGEIGILSGIQMSVTGGAGSYDARLRIFVDQEAVASFDVDLGTLFVSHNDAHTGAGQSMGTNHIQMDVVGTGGAWVDGGGDNTMASYQMLFPVPYSNGVRVEVYTPAGVTVPGSGTALYTMIYRHQGQASTLRLRSACVSRIDAAAGAVNLAAADVPVFDIPNNYGWMVWWSMACFGASNYSYLERPYFWFIDGESTAAFVKTGGEEYGATGWYFGLQARMLQPALMLTSSNNAARQMTVGYDLLQMHGGIRFTNELRMVWGNKPAVPATSNHKFGFAALFYIDSAVPFVPTAPRSVTGSTGGGSGQIIFSWLPPLSTGSKPLSGYSITLSPGGASQTVLGNVLTATFSGLTNGTAYTPTVTAINSVGSSAAATGAPVTATAGATVPGAPTIGTATAGSASATVAFTAPGSNGGSAITGYTATSTPGGFTGTGAASPITVSGLTNGTAYTFTVHATNAIGNSAESAASNSVTPAVAGAAISDDFNRADNTTLGVTPVGAKTWATFATVGALVGIASNRAFINSSGTGNTYAYVVSASANIDVTATLAVIGSNPNYAGVIARVVDQSNMVLLQYDASGPTATTYSAYKEIAGAYTLLGSSTGITPAAGDVLRLTVTGTNTVDFYVNGTHFGPYTATGISASSVNAGLQGASSAGSTASTARFDNFAVA